MYLTLASIGQKVLAFVYFLLLARIMQPENTGAYFLALSITTMFGVIADFGVTPVVIREVAKEPGNARDLVRRALGAKIPLMLFGAGGSFVATILLGYEPIVQWLVLIACAILMADAISLLSDGVVRGHHALQFETLGI